MWSRALDVRLSEWCCSVSMMWVQIPWREEQKFDTRVHCVVIIYFYRVYGQHDNSVEILNIMSYLLFFNQLNNAGF
jgi:hypothetical protein